MVYGDFDGPGQRKNKANQSQLPAIGWKSDNSGCLAGRLLPRVGRETRRVGRNSSVWRFLLVKVTLMLIRYVLYVDDYEYEQDEAAGLAELAESLSMSRGLLTQSAK